MSTFDFKMGMVGKEDPVVPPLGALWTKERTIQAGQGVTTISRKKGKMVEQVKIPSRLDVSPEDLDYMSGKRNKIIDKTVQERMSHMSPQEQEASRLAEFVFLEAVDGVGLSTIAPRALGIKSVMGYRPLLVDDYRGTDAILLFSHDQEDETEDVGDRAYPISVDVTVGTQEIETKAERSFKQAPYGKSIYWYDTVSEKRGEVFSWPKEGKIVATPVSIYLPASLVLEAAGEQVRSLDSARAAMRELGALIRYQLRDELEWIGASLVQMATFKRGLLLPLLDMLGRKEGPKAIAAQNVYHALTAIYSALENQGDTLSENRYRERYGSVVPREIRQFHRWPEQIEEKRRSVG